MAFKFNNKECVYCHEKLPAKTEAISEIEVADGRPFKVGKCPKCGGEQRLVEIKS